MSRDDASKPAIEHTVAFRPAGVPIHDAVVAEERSGLVHAKAPTAKPVDNAIAPPLSEKPIPTSSIAERLRERVKKGG
jgi:hypothetical protein